MSSSVQLVCFDLGRVLLRICDGWTQACELAGLPRPNVLADLNDATRARIDGILEKYDSGRIDLNQFAREIAPLRGLEPAHVIAIDAAYLLGPYDGAAELLEELQARRVRTACLSNTTATHWKKMMDTADPVALPMHLLTHHFASHLLGMCKPEDAIYEHVERATGVAGESIVFFDDIKKNVAGASRRGWRGFQIQTDSDPIAQARKCLRDLHVL